MVRGGQPELAPAVGVEQVRAQHPLVDDHGAAHRQTLAVERPGAEGARDGAVVHDGDRRGGHPLAQLADQERRSPVQRGSRGRARDVPHERRGHVGVEDHRDLRGLDPPRPEPSQGAPGRDAADLLGGVQTRALPRDVIPGVALHLRVLGRYRGDREAERGGAVFAREAVAGRIGVARASVPEVAALGVGDARIDRERGRLAAAGQLDLALRRQVVSLRVGQAQIRYLPRELGRVGQSRHLVRARDARERDRLVHQAAHRLAGEIGGRGGGHRLAHEDAQGHVLLARVLDRVHLAQPHLGRERLVLDHEGVGRGGAPASGLLQEIGEEVLHARLRPGSRRRSCRRSGWWAAPPPPARTGRPCRRFPRLRRAGDRGPRGSPG